MWRYERGSWEPTIFAINEKNFCNVMYNKDQYWYKYWTIHVTNLKEVESKCINHKGVSCAMYL